MKPIFSLLGALFLASVPCVAGPFLFSQTSSPGNQMLVVDGGDAVFDTSQSRFRIVDNQGWWSLDLGNLFNNANYLVGVDSSGNQYRNFFTFDLSGWNGGATSAYLSLPRGNSGGPLPALYRLSDVSTAAQTLNTTIGIRPGIYDDLGTGVVFGSVVVSDLASPDPLIIEFNAQGVAALNAAAGGFFSVGGSLEPVPEPATAALVGVLLLGLGALRARSARA